MSESQQSEAGEITLRIFRFEPGVDGAPRYDTYQVPKKPDMRVLDALNHVYEEQDPSLAHRWYCGTKKCGECALTVNGEPMLGCWEPAQDEMVCEPLANFPIIRDLVVDTAAYERIIVGLKPRLTRRRAPGFPERVGHQSMAAAHRLSKCIECNVCTAAVPVNGIDKRGVDWTGHAGAAALVRFARFVLDPRDDTDRKQLAANAGLASFPLYENLKNICPQGIDIVDDALVPARQKLFGVDGETEPAPDAITVFVMANGWSAWIRLTVEQREALIDAGTLRATPTNDIEQAYRLMK